MPGTSRQPLFYPWKALQLKRWCTFATVDPLLHCWYFWIQKLTFSCKIMFLKITCIEHWMCIYFIIFLLKWFISDYMKLVVAWYSIYELRITLAFRPQACITHNLLILSLHITTTKLDDSLISQSLPWRIVWWIKVCIFFLVGISSHNAFLLIWITLGKCHCGVGKCLTRDHEKPKLIV